MCSAPGARPIPFTADTTIDARRSGFSWEARLRAGKILPMLVTDAYEEGHGRLIVKVAGALPVVNGRGPEFDKGELQRYLGGISLCPAVLVSHRTLDWQAVGNRTLRLRDTLDTTGATVDIEIGYDGCPLSCHADRPRAVGKTTIQTPWLAASFDYREFAGMRVATRLEAAWTLPEGQFTYYRGEVSNFEVEY